MCDKIWGVKLQFIILAGLIIMAGGCAGKRQSSTPEVIRPAEIPEKEISRDADAALSGSEVAALKSTGHLDKNVPPHIQKEVAQEYKYFLRDGRKIMDKFTRQSEQYLPYARKVFRERGMPEELANLAIVESGYRANAVSKAGAAGAWQFMPFTGRKYGLCQDWWQDERLDPYRATEAAADYLQKLYNDFGDWPTAVAAYNAGEGKMQRAKEGTGANNFFEVTQKNHLLDYKTQLREETTRYVPRFLAITKIMRNLPQLGFEAHDPANVREMARLEVAPGTDLLSLSRACDMNWSDFQKYNQHHKRAITCTDRKTYIYVPKISREKGLAYLGASTNYAGWQPVKVAAKDSLESISKRNNIPLNRLRLANPGLGSLRAGQTIIAPPAINLRKTAVADNKAARTVKDNRTALAAKGRTHELKRGETLYSVAQKYNVSVEDMAKHNGISAKTTLMAGKVLRIPAKNAPAQGSSNGRIGKAVKKTHVVRSKENLWSIAKKYNVSVDDLKRWNKVDEKSLKAGASLMVEAN